MQTAIIIPTYNGADTIGLLLESIEQQSIKPNHILVIDSSSSDNTAEILKKYALSYHVIKQSDFNHGGTRGYATSLVDADIYILLTQDVRFANKYALESILDSFKDEKIGCAYGRQLPNRNADVLASHTRLFAYPIVGSIKSYEDRIRLGLNTCFNSDNFAVYKKQALIDIGGFPENAIVSEDMYVAAKMLINGWKIAYNSDAMIYHSHNYTVIEEFKRYFDIGIFHAMNPWILKTFKSDICDGIEYLKSLTRYCINNKAYATLPKGVIGLLINYIGFCAGKYYKLFKRE